MAKVLHSMRVTSRLSTSMLALRSNSSNSLEMLDLPKDDDILF